MRLRLHTLRYRLMKSYITGESIVSAHSGSRCSISCLELEGSDCSSELSLAHECNSFIIHLLATNPLHNDIEGEGNRPGCMQGFSGFGPLGQMFTDVCVDTSKPATQKPIFLVQQKYTTNHPYRRLFHYSLNKQVKWDHKGWRANSDANADDGHVSTLVCAAKSPASSL